MLRWSVNELAARAGVSPTTINRFERELAGYRCKLGPLFSGPSRTPESCLTMVAFATAPEPNDRSLLSTYWVARSKPGKYSQQEITQLLARPRSFPRREREQRLIATGFSRTIFSEKKTCLNLPKRRQHTLHRSSQEPDLISSSTSW